MSAWAEKKNLLEKFLLKSSSFTWKRSPFELSNFFSRKIFIFKRSSTFTFSFALTTILLFVQVSFSDKDVKRFESLVSFRISLRWPIHIINAVDKTKLSCYTSHRRSTTVSFETCPSVPNIWCLYRAVELIFEDILAIVVADCFQVDQYIKQKKSGTYILPNSIAYSARFPFLVYFPF